MGDTLRQWRPSERDLDPDEVLAGVSWSRDGRGVAIGMVVGIDGGVTIKGTSGGLGSVGDKAAFHALRNEADVILVGAGTVRAEGYGPVVRRETAVEVRQAQGRAAVARLAVVTGRLDISAADRIFQDPDNPPIIVTSHAGPQETAATLVEAGAQIVRAGENRVDLADAVRQLHGMGLAQVLCEGGPSLNTSMLKAGLVDELFVTLAPTITASDRHLVTQDLGRTVNLELIGVIAAGSELLLRYRIIPQQVLR